MIWQLHTKWESINSVEALKEHCEYICSKLPVPDNIGESIPFLNMLRLFELGIGGAEETFSKRYNLDLENVKKYYL